MGEPHNMTISHNGKLHLATLKLWNEKERKRILKAIPSHPKYTDGKRKR